MFSKINEADFDWKKSTIKRIQDLLYENSFAVDTNNISAKDDKLVVLYGPPQIGKTSLILFLLGINEKYHYNNSDKTLYTILRGKSDSGASTATAVSYKQSRDDSFYINGKLMNSSEDVIQEMADIRNAVEENRYKKDIVNIAIPKAAFFKDKMEDVSNLILIDMPGIGSTVIKEHQYVNDVYKQFLSLATAIIVVINSENIQLLASQSGTPYGLLQDNWFRYSRYLLVTTKSFSAESVLNNYFKKEKQSKSFYDYINDEIKSIVDNLEGFKGCNLPCFEFDLGASLDAVKSKLNDQCYNILLDTNEQMASDLRQEIQKHKGDNLDNIIENLINDYSANIEQEIKYNNYYIDDAEISKQKYGKKITKYEEDEKVIKPKKIKILEEIAKLEENYNKQDINDENSLSPFKITSIALSMQQTYLNDIDKAMKGIRLHKTKVSMIRDAILKYEEMIIKCIQQDGSIERGSVVFDHLLRACKSLYKTDIADSYTGRQRYFYKISVENFLKDFYKNIKIEIVKANKAYFQECIQKLSKQLQNIEEDEKVFNKNKVKYEQKINDESEKINKLNDINKQTLERKERILSQLKNYMEFAEEEFNKCKNVLINKINNSYNKYEKMEYFLYLSKKELEYKKIKEHKVVK